MLAIAWGGEDVVDLAKELDRLQGVKDFEGFECRGGALDGARLEAGDVKLVAKWPTRAEQLSILSGQISSLGGRLSGQISRLGGPWRANSSRGSKTWRRPAAGRQPPPDRVCPGFFGAGFTPRFLMV
jgi:hypothetical protein